MAAVRVDGVVVDALVVESDDCPRGSAPLAAFGSSERWQQLQRLRRGQLAPKPLIAALCNGSLEPQSDLLAALWGQLDREDVERLLGSGAAANATPWLEASRLELPALASQPAVERAWLEPLLAIQQEAAPDQQLAWLEVLAQFLDPRVGQRLRRLVLETSRQITSGEQEAEAAIGFEAVLPLVPLLGRQRQRQDGVLLLQCSLEPGPLAWRRAALEGVALGLSSWPLPLLTPALVRLASDLSPALANQAIDLLARLPDGQRQLRRLVNGNLEASARERLRRRRLCTPLLLLVHGRQGGAIPAVYDDLARALEQRRRAPVLIQALTGTTPAIDQRLQQRASVAGAITLVPLLLLPGDHVRRDLPAIASSWRQGLAKETATATVTLRRRPFLGAWPCWQQLLAQELPHQAQGRRWLWLHHPLQGTLAERYLAHLGRILGQPGCPTDAAEAAISAAAGDARPLLLAPLSLAANRFTESLRMERSTPSEAVLPPLLDLPAVREFLLSQLEALP
ncbi:MAG: hypothetical protein RLZZ624_1279 [Cyanobacteriota bacterium]|jgi:sirohydrochlorin ferrochelatase